MKLLLFFLIAFTYTGRSQIDSGMYTSPHASLLLSGGGIFELRETGGFVNGYVRGRYTLHANTLTLIDIIDEKENTERSTSYVYKDSVLTFAGEAFKNYKSLSDKERQDHAIPADAVIKPPSLEKYNTFKKEPYSWNFQYSSSFPSLRTTALLSELIIRSTDEKLGPDAIKRIEDSSRLKSRKDIWISKDSFSRMLNKVMVIDTYRLYQINVTKADSAHVTIEVLYMER